MNFPIDTRLVLSPSDKLNPLWDRLVKHYEARLAQLRSQNDRVQPEAETAALRGQIREVKAFLDLNRQAPELDP